MFVHLRLHTEFSVVDGTNRIDEVFKVAAADGQPALAVTDLNNLFGAIKFYKEGRSKGVKPILGVEVITEGLGADPSVLQRVVLLAQNHTGYLHLCELLARGWTHHVHKEQAVLPWSLIEQHTEGLILLSGAQAGSLGQALLQGDEARAREVALKMAAAFPHRFYIELQRAGRADDEAHVQAAVPLAARLSLPVVATHPVQFTGPDDYEAHEVRVCISEREILANPRRVRKYTREQYFKSSDQMAELFADIPSALANSVAIARRSNLTLVLGKPQLPNYPTPEVDGRRLSIEEYFRFASHQGLSQRLSQLYLDPAQREAQRPTYEARLEFEIDIILKMGFPGYFLIVGDFINWAKNNGCPVGPGRGSGAGSLVAYALQITDLDPLRYNLLFERFLNPERVSMPDFDIDFCQGNRDRVIEYVKDKYGREAVSQIATFGTMAARAAIRDVGRVLDMSYTFCDGISKLIPNKPGQHITIADAIAAEPLLAERLQKEEDVRTLIELAQKLEGLSRNVGMHAGGVLIAPGKLTDFCPLYQQPGSDSAVSQYDKDDVESAGLVKFDFLGLATLTILEHARDLIRTRHQGQEHFSFDHIPLDDAATYKLFQDGRTEAVFQFESRGMQGMLRDARPSRLEDLIALNALYRPGPMDLIPTFIARKHGREEVEYPHPMVEPVLSETYGIMVYQEQVMQTAQILGGYSLGGADLLRRAMGKKKPEEMAQHREIFRDGASKNGISQPKADEIFDLMERFAGYGFNKSHAAAYSLLAYQTGWLKVHYTAEFFCANLTIELDNTDKIKVLLEDARKMGLQIEPPDINRGHHVFEPVCDQLIRYGLGAIKGTGKMAIEAIVAARNEGGPFTSLFDFYARIDRTRVNKRTVEALIKAGAFDSIQLNRAALVASIDRSHDFAQSLSDNANQGGLFDMVDSHASSTAEPELVRVTPWGVKERLSFEKSAIGFYLSGHLFDESAAEVQRFVKRRIDDLVDSREPQLLAGIVSELRVVQGQRGRLAIFKLDDKSASIEATADEATLNANRDLLREDELVIVMAKAQPDRFSGGGLRLSVQQVWSLAAARCRFGKYLSVQVNGKTPDIDRLLREFPAQVQHGDEGELVRGLPVRIHLLRDGASAQIQLGERARFYPTDAALASWMAQAHEGQAHIVYD
ncbi:MAG: DNA polymerase III subunit alpha [Alphaproteobacteria bacterium]|nr:DNA polymerase III subunit alpha [Alphaproteobacteria bacterium]